VILLGDLHLDPGLVTNFFCYLLNLTPSVLDRSLGTPQRNRSLSRFIRFLIDIDGSDTGIVLDLVDLSSSTSENARESLDGDGESNDVSVFFLVGNEIDQFTLCGLSSFRRTSNDDLGGRGRGFGVFCRGFAFREVDSNFVLFFETLEVGTLFTDERSTVESGGERNSESDLVGLYNRTPVSSRTRNLTKRRRRTIFEAVLLTLLAASSTFSFLPLIVTLLNFEPFLFVVESSWKSTRTPKSSLNLLTPDPAFPTT